MHIFATNASRLICKNAPEKKKKQGRNLVPSTSRGFPQISQIILANFLEISRHPKLRMYLNNSRGKIKSKLEKIKCLDKYINKQVSKKMPT